RCRAPGRSFRPESGSRSGADRRVAAGRGPRRRPPPTDGRRAGPGSVGRTGRCRGRRAGRARRARPARRPRWAPPGRPRGRWSRQSLRGLPGVRPLAVLAVGRIIVVGADGDELVQRVEIVDEELSVEVIQLVLEGPSEEPGSGDLDLLAVPVLGYDPDLLPARDVGVVAGQRKAALEVAIVAGRPNDLRVHELVERVADLDDAGLEGLTQLGRRQPDAGGVAHRVGEIIEQPMEELPEAVDRQALQPEARITEEDDRADAHGRESSIAIRRF